MTLGTRRATASRVRQVPAARVAAAVPRLSLPSGIAVQRAINMMVPVINNTPIRRLLDVVEGSAPGVTSVRLLGAPVSTTISPDGTRAFVITRSTFSGQSLTVNVIDTKTNSIVGVPIAFEGSYSAVPLWSPDGTRAYLPIRGSDSTVLAAIDERSGRVVGTSAVIAGVAGLVAIPGADYGYLVKREDSGSTLTKFDTTTGAVVGPSVEVADGYYSFNPAANRLYVSSQQVTDSSPIVVSTIVTVLDTTNNAVVGGPVTLDGQPVGGVLVSPDGTWTAQLTRGFDSFTTTATMLDPGTGAVVGTPITLPGWTDDRGSPQFTQNGARLSVFTNDGTQSQVTVIDTASGSLVGAPVVLAEGNFASDHQTAVPDVAGDRLAISSKTLDTSTGTYHTVVTIIDTNDSTAVGTPVVLDGGPVLGGGPSLVVSPDGSRVLQSTTTSGPTVTVAMIGMDGALISPPVVISGQTSDPVVVSPDGSRAYQAAWGRRPTVTAIDTDTGAVIDDPVAVKGGYYYGGRLLLTPDGTQLYAPRSVTVFGFDVIIPVPIWPFIVATQFQLTWGRVDVVDTTVI
jgi:hypothetical protein